MTETPTAIDFFSGAGGASLGIHAANFNLTAAVDIESQPLQTHNENLPSEVIKHDLSDVDLSVLPTTDVAYSHGSPPCKGFSTANDERDIDDPRNSLVFDYLSWVDKLQPKVVTMENVTGMINITNHFMDRVEGAFRDAGYRVKWRTLNAADYGVPQTRKRVFTVGIREDLPVPSRWFPKPTHAETATTTLEGRELAEWITVQEAIGDLPPTGQIDGHTAQGVTSSAKRRTGSEPSHAIGAESSNYIQKLTDQINETHQKNGRRPLQDGCEPINTIRAGTPPLMLYNHVAPNHDDDDTLKRLAGVDHGKNEHPAYHRPEPDEPSDAIIAGHMSQPIHYDTIPNHEPRDSTDDDPMKWEYEEPTKTLGADARMPDKAPNQDEDDHHRWSGARRLTVRECARLQSFPDWFVFTGTKTEQYAQVGNAVPPLLQYHVAKHLKEVLDGAQ